MRSFIESCNCKGSRPSGIVGNRLHSRPDLVGELLRNRHIARFVIAPAGSGKSSIVFEYASIMFAFKHVFWMDCTSPCFLRDLDSGCIFDEVLKADDEVQLLVCEDVPPLDPDRCAALDQLVDALIERGCEFIATCNPSAGSFTNMQVESIKIEAHDLLLSDDEMSIEELHGTIGDDWRHVLTQCDRVACLRWSSDGARMLLSGIRDEQMHEEDKLAAFILLVGEEGSTDILKTFISEDELVEVLGSLADNHPFLGITEQGKYFKALNVDMKDLSKEFINHIDSWAQYSLQGNREKLCATLANLLLVCGKHRRSCELLEYFSAKEVAAKWLYINGWSLIKSMHPFEFVHLFDGCKKGCTSFKSEMALLYGWALLFLGEVESAAKIALQVKSRSKQKHMLALDASMLSVASSPDMSSNPALIAGELDNAENQLATDVKDALRYCPVDLIELAKVLSAVSTGSMEVLDDMMLSSSDEQQKRESIDSEAASCKDTMHLAMAIIFKAISNSPAIAVKLFGSMAALDVNSYDEGALTGAVSDPSIVANAGIMRRALSFLDAELDKATYSSTGDIFLHAASKNAQVVSKILPVFQTAPFGKATSRALRTAEAKMAMQREELRRYREDDAQKKAAKERSESALGRRGYSANSRTITVSPEIPILTVNLFGGLHASIADKPVDPKLLTRRKAIVTLALLIIAKGHEVSRSQIAECLWPGGDVDTYTKNFYGIWSSLRKALKVEGQCPYLVRSQAGYRIENRYVTSDVYLYDDLCRKLLFGVDESVAWEKLYEQVSQDFADELLPAETDNMQITALRNKYKSNLIDGLIATSSKLNATGEPQGALWFAREAMRRDDKREDSYIALMEAQISSNQRGAALDTYFACRRFLSEELGIDPSLKVVELYRSIIESEEILM